MLCFSQSVSVCYTKWGERMKKIAVYAGTRNLYEAMRVSVTSLLKNNEMDSVFLLIEDDLFPYDMPEEVCAINVSKQQFFPESGVNYKARWTYMAMMRIACAKMFPNVERMLYLDCDTIIDDDISELFETDMTGCYFAGVKESAKSRETPYINTGVLVMNLAEIRRDGIDDKLIWLLNSQKMTLPDQDAINLLAQGHIYFLPSEYNVCSFTEPPERIRIYHFASSERFDNDPIYKKYSGKKVPTRTLIAVPCMAMMHTDFVRCLLAIQHTGEVASVLMPNSLIYDARNAIAQNAIRSGFDRVLWLDSDITFKPDTLVKLSEDLDGGRDYVSGLYFMRTLPTKPVLFSEIKYEVTDNDATVGHTFFLNYPKDTLFQCAGTGFGCVMTSTAMLKAMVEKYGAPFTPVMGLGEDLSFCYRAKLCGFNLYCDSRVKCGHVANVEINEGHWLNQQK